MNKLFLGLFALCLTAQVNAQQRRYQITVNPYAGFELNLLKAPATYLSPDGQKTGIKDLWVNAPFAGTKLKWAIYSKDKKRTLEFNTNYRRALFTAKDNLKAQDLNLAVYYKFNHPSKRIKNSLKVGFRDYVKTGEDQDNLLGTPLSYRRFDLANRLKLRPRKNIEFTIHPYSTVKFYQMSNFDQFMYFDNGLNLAATHNFNLKRKVGFAIYASTHQRNYSIHKSGNETIEMEEDEEDDLDLESNRRVWRYYSAGIGLRTPINQKLKIVSRLNYTLRKDLIQEKLGYNQVELNVDLNYTREKWKLGATTSINYRMYNNFGITTNGQRSLLRYIYLKETGYLKYNFSDQLSLDFRAAAKMRLSNVNDVNRRAARSYFIGELSVGLVWKINHNDRSPRRKFNF
ncbi:MAG: hypothetical protein ACI8ZM_002531 [Crocinitomix sp.]|jgi:hypothetical protein